jgi:hypothetical protein
MRHYKISVGSFLWDSAPGGSPDPGALQVDLDITVVSADVGTGAGTVRIWGVGLQTILQANQLNQKTISIYGGMARGLPLAKPQQFGLLATGTVTQAYGDWEGINQFLVINFQPGGAAPAAPGPNSMPPKTPIVLNWQKGQPFGPAVQTALQGAFPGMSVILSLAQQLTAQQDQVGYYPSLRDFNYFLRRLTQQMIGGSYQGVSIDASQGNLQVFDQQQQASTLSQEDFIGFPVWIEPQTIQCKLVMRGDIKLQSTITLPQTWSNVGQSAGSSPGVYFNQASLQGTFWVRSIRHVGNSRAPTGDAWVTIIECVANQTQQMSSTNQQQGGQ